MKAGKGRREGGTDGGRDGKEVPISDRLSLPAEAARTLKV